MDLAHTQSVIVMPANHHLLEKVKLETQPSVFKNPQWHLPVDFVHAEMPVSIPLIGNTKEERTLEVFYL